jgi:hypothetical protein
MGRDDDSHPTGTEHAFDAVFARKDFALANTGSNVMRIVHAWSLQRLEDPLLSRESDPRAEAASRTERASRLQPRERTQELTMDDPKSGRFLDQPNLVSL